MHHIKTRLIAQFIIKSYWKRKHTMCTFDLLCWFSDKCLFWPIRMCRFHIWSHLANRKNACMRKPLPKWLLGNPTWLSIDIIILIATTAQLLLRVNWMNGFSLQWRKVKWTGVYSFCKITIQVDKWVVQLLSHWVECKCGTWRSYHSWVVESNQVKMDALLERSLHFKLLSSTTTMSLH